MPARPIVSGNGTPCENLSGYVEGILKPIVQRTPSFCRDTMVFLQKLSTHGAVEPGALLVTMDVSTLYTSIHDDGIAATASVLNADNCQSPDAILQLIRFILDNKPSPSTTSSSSRHMEQPWGPNSHFNMPTSSCTGSNKTSSPHRTFNRRCTLDTLMTFSSFGLTEHSH